MKLRLTRLTVNFCYTFVFIILKSLFFKCFIVFIIVLFYNPEIQLAIPRFTALLLLSFFSRGFFIYFMCTISLCCQVTLHCYNCVLNLHQTEIKYRLNARLVLNTTVEQMVEICENTFFTVTLTKRLKSEYCPRCQVQRYVSLLQTKHYCGLSAVAYLDHNVQNRPKYILSQDGEIILFFCIRTCFTLLCEATVAEQKHTQVYMFHTDSLITMFDLKLQGLICKLISMFMGIHSIARMLCLLWL